MNTRIRAWRDGWQQLSRRDRQLCLLLGVFLLGVFSVYGLWQPAQQRLATAQTLYLKNLALAAEVQRARPTQTLTVFEQPLSTRLSESAAAAGLNVQQFEVDAQVLRITLNGDAQAVLNWLARIEQEGASFETLSLEKRDQSLEAQLLISNPQ